MAAKVNHFTEPPADRDFAISRVFDAPRRRAFEAWTDPKLLVQWWGPHTFTNPLCEMDLRPGGAHRVALRSPEGVEYPIKGAYREIREPARLVMALDCSEHPAEWHDLVNPNRGKEDANPAGELLQTVTFEDLNDRTKLTIRTRFASVAIRDAMLKLGMTEGWSQSLERLADLVTSAADREIVSARVFDVPRDLVFRAWTGPEHLAKWWGPRGFTNTIHEFDLRPGGVWRFVMHGPEGSDHRNKSVFVEVVKPERIVFDHVSDPQFQGGGRHRGTSRQDQADVLHDFRVCRRMRQGEDIRRRGERAELRPAGHGIGQDVLNVLPRSS